MKFVLLFTSTSQVGSTKSVSFLRGACCTYVGTYLSTAEEEVFNSVKFGNIYIPRELKTAETSNPVKKHDVSEKKTGSVQKMFCFQITRHFLWCFLQINIGCLQDIYHIPYKLLNPSFLRIYPKYRVSPRSLGNSRAL